MWTAFARSASSSPRSHRSTLRGTTGLAVPWILLLTVEAVASLALYGAAVRRWNDRMAGAIAVALYHLIPLEFRAGATAGAIPVVGQTLSLLALALVVSSRVRLDGTVATLGLAALLTAAFVSEHGNVRRALPGRRARRHCCFWLAAAAHSARRAYRYCSPQPAPVRYSSSCITRSATARWATLSAGNLR
jgi:hypothetical protein